MQSQIDCWIDGNNFLELCEHSAKSTLLRSRLTQRMSIILSVRRSVRVKLAKNESSPVKNAYNDQNQEKITLYLLKKFELDIGHIFMKMFPVTFVRPDIFAN